MEKTNLVIVESSAKAKTIEKYLKNSPQLKGHGTFQVVASIGHVVDLPPKELGIDTETWNMTYVPIAGKNEIIKKLKDLTKRSTMVYLAADPDREGEAIAKNLYDVLGLKPEKTRRATFHEITPRAITEAILNPREIDRALVDAQEARRILDRIVGYKLSPLLWRRFSGSGLSAGRVQTAALSMVVERFKEIASFEPQPTWRVHGTFMLMEEETCSTVLEGDPLVEKKNAETLMKELARKAQTAHWCVAFRNKEVKKHPFAPFTTSSLQQEAYERYSMGAKTTMLLAQGLYEAGHITYMRTDSTSLSKDAKCAVHSYIATKFGESSVKDRDFQTRVVNAQEAHECIRPTNITITYELLEPSQRITNDHRKLYDLVWRRAVASQMVPATYMELKTSITADKDQMPVLDGRAFVGSSRVLIDRGYLAVWQPSSEAKPEQARELLKKGTSTTARAEGFRAEGDFTRPSCLFQEPGLIKGLEKEGIGRPSTYATIIDKLFSKGYVSRGQNPTSVLPVIHYHAHMDTKKVGVEETTTTIGGGKSDRFVPTSLGTRVIDYLMEATPDAVNIGFTAEMEAKLDSISNHEMDKNSMLEGFYRDFNSTIAKALEMQKEKKTDKPYDKDAEKKPKSILKQIDNDASVVQTRYGPAIFISSEKRFVSILPYLEWKDKTIQDLSARDTDFLRKLPIRISNPANQEEWYDIAIGRYGLYAKRDGTNLRLDKCLWDAVQEGRISYKDVHKGIKKTQDGAQKSRWNQKKQG